MRTIAQASQQETATSEEIQASVESISRISQETARAMDSSSGAVEGLARQAKALRGLIDSLRAQGADQAPETLPSGGKIM